MGWSSKKRLVWIGGVVGRVVINRIFKGGVVIPLVFPKVPQSSLGIPKGSPVTPSPWTPPP